MTSRRTQSRPATCRRLQSLARSRFESGGVHGRGCIALDWRGDEIGEPMGNDPYNAVRPDVSVVVLHQFCRPGWLVDLSAGLELAHHRFDVEDRRPVDCVEAPNVQVAPVNAKDLRS